MRTLCIADEFPWPESNGYRIRLANMLRALAELGEVELFAVATDGRPPDSYLVPPEASVVRAHVVRDGPLPRTVGRVARWFRSDLPRRILWRDWVAARRELLGWARPPYDLVWFSQPDVYVALGHLVSGPRIVDLVDVEDAKARQRRQVLAADRRRGRGPRPFALRSQLARVPNRVDERRWARLLRRIASAAAAVVVCSELERCRLEADAVVVVPNGYELPTGNPAPRAEERDASVITMVGLLSYEPNADGARFFVDEVLPAVRARRPEVELRLVGSNDHVVRELGARPGVTVCGEVSDVGDELARASVIVVPVRFGGGTRIKVLEAFANRVPVVSTTFGCAGLDVVDGRHLLVADDPDAFAAACVEILGDADLRRRLTDAAFELYRFRYQWRDIRPAVTALARSVAGETTRGRAPEPA